MNRLLRGALTLTLSLSAGVASAQPQALQPETTPEACSDRLDNDGDGFIDCMDQDCQRLAICQAPQQPPPGASQQYAPPPPPPPGYPPTPGYYAPGPPVYAVPPPGGYPPPNGVGTLIMGSIFFVSGVALIGGGAVLYNTSRIFCSGLNSGLGCTSNGYYTDNVDFDAAVALLVVGSALTVMGAIFVPVGAIKMARYSRWKHDHHLAGLDLQPTIAATGHSGQLGFKLTF